MHMGLKLTIATPKAYVRAVSGLFISTKHPKGLTIKEMNIIAKLMEHGDGGSITQSAREATMKELKIERQNFYNTMSDLKGKHAIQGEELHKVFTSDKITLTNANN